MQESFIELWRDADSLPCPRGVEAKTFAVTIQPDEGSSTPTMPIVMMGGGG